MWNPLEQLGSSISSTKTQLGTDGSRLESKLFEGPYPEKPITKKGWWSGSRCRPCVQALAPEKTKTKTKKSCLVHRMFSKASVEQTIIKHPSPVLGTGETS
jgi:hypothetical protein